MLRAKVKQGLAAAEVLKRRMRETTSPAATPTSTTDTFPVDLRNDNELSDAYQRCLNGNHLVSLLDSFVNFGMICISFQMNAHRYGQACEEYQMGLSVMLRARQSE